MNLILMTDSYKVSHWKQYPKGTEKVYSYFESRGGEYDKVVFFGLQYIINEYLSGQVINRTDQIDEAAKLFEAHFGSKEVFNRKGWEYIEREHNGYLPIEIKAVPEGSLKSTHDVLFTVENTDPNCFWLTSYLETLLEQVWYPCTVATRSYMMKQTIKAWLELTGHDAPAFKLHDFGYRGSTSQESAALGGAAHLLNFMGSDTLAAIPLIKEYYGSSMPAFSIPAAEHSTITSWGKHREFEAYQNMLRQFPTGLVAVVSDSYDIYTVCKNVWGNLLKDKILGRDGTLVIRPDSGDPLVVLPEILKILGEAFDWKKNDKGYYVLPPQVRVIQGDGIDEYSLMKILDTLEQHEISADNIAFGSGGGLLQKVDRDTLKFAYKCSNITINGKDQDVFKDPITDPRKKSQTGRFDSKDLRTVFLDGRMMNEESFETIRKRLI